MVGELLDLQTNPHIILQEVSFFTERPEWDRYKGQCSSSRAVSTGSPWGRSALSCVIFTESRPEVTCPKRSEDMAMLRWHHRLWGTTQRYGHPIPTMTRSNIIIQYYYYFLWMQKGQRKQSWTWGEHCPLWDTVLPEKKKTIERVEKIKNLNTILHKKLTTGANCQSSWPNAIQAVLHTFTPASLKQHRPSAHQPGLARYMTPDKPCWRVRKGERTRGLTPLKFHRIIRLRSCHQEEGEVPNL